MGHIFRSLRFAALSCLFVTLVGCTGLVNRWGTHSQLQSRAEKVKVIAVAQPNVKIYQLTAGGVRDLMDEWCNTGSRHFTKSVLKQVGERSVAIKPLEGGEETSKELEDVYALYNAISVSINWHTFMGDEDFFPHKLEYFDYSVGSIESILKRNKADALFVVNAYDEISTGGRKALMAVGNLLSVIGVDGPRKGITVISMALFDKSGAMLWYNQRGSVGQLDMREQSDVEDVTTELLETFPRIGK